MRLTRAKGLVIVGLLGFLGASVTELATAHWREVPSTASARLVILELASPQCRRRGSMIGGTGGAR